jgi:hypothetical protein
VDLFYSHLMLELTYVLVNYHRIYSCLKRKMRICITYVGYHDDSYKSQVVLLICTCPSQTQVSISVSEKHRSGGK